MRSAGIFYDKNPPSHEISEYDTLEEEQRSTSDDLFEGDVTGSAVRDTDDKVSEVKAGVGDLLAGGGVDVREQLAGQHLLPRLGSVAQHELGRVILFLSQNLTYFNFIITKYCLINVLQVEGSRDRGTQQSEEAGSTRDVGVDQSVVIVMFGGHEALLI